MRVASASPPSWDTRAVARTRHDVPFPRSREKWKQYVDPRPAAAGVKTWSAFAKRASLVSVMQDRAEYRVLPSVRTGRNAFDPVTERERTLYSPSDAELGRLVLDELAFALERDSCAR